tara:strand:- start:84 stop:584 length:501 start_codon:yes stop_codon:yes gene_type:complete
MTEKLSRTAVNTAIKNAISGEMGVSKKWKETAGVCLKYFGADNNNHFLLANAGVMAMNILKGQHSADEIKEFKLTLKNLSKDVKQMAESMKHSNPNLVWTRLLKYMREESGLAHFKQATAQRTDDKKFCTNIASASKLVDAMPQSVQDKFLDLLEVMIELELIKEK